MDIYIKRSNGQVSGPRSEAWLVNHAAAGNIADDDLIAKVSPGARPVAEDYQPVTEELLGGFAPGTASASSHADPPGGFLRLTGALIAGIGSLLSVAGLATGEITLVIAGVIESLFYGGLLWAAGTVVGQLDVIKRQFARR